jgi:hypothetical protein
MLLATMKLLGVQTVVQKIGEKGPYWAEPEWLLVRFLLV